MFPESLHSWRTTLQATGHDLFDVIENAIKIASVDHPREFQRRRDQIMLRLFSSKPQQSLHSPCDEDDGRVSNKESEVLKGASGVERNQNPGICTHGVGSGSEATNDEIKERTRIVEEVVKIKELLDTANRGVADSMMLDCLTKLQSMPMTIDILETTKIGISVNSLRKRCGSKQIAQFARKLVTGWKATVKEFFHTSEQAIPESVKPSVENKGDHPFPPSNEATVIATSTVIDGTKDVRNNPTVQESKNDSRNDGPSPSTKQDYKNIANLQKGQHPTKMNALETVNKEDQHVKQRESIITKPKVGGGSSNVTAPAPKKNIGCLDKVALEKKFEASKRKFQDYYQKEQREKKRRAMQFLDLRDIPKQFSDLHDIPKLKTHKNPIAKSKQPSMIQAKEQFHDVPKSDSHMNLDRKTKKYQLVKKEGQNRIFILKLKA